MADVIVIGAGLTGLAATYELQQQGIEPTLIEVKRRVGGSIRSIEQAGFVLDAGAFALADTLDETQLAPFGLQDACYLEGGAQFFHEGTQTLVDALAAQISAPRLMRMAVSSVGELEDEGGFGICLENGLLLRAKAVIVTVPLRYAERLFYGYITEITERLLQIEMQTIQRVSWGFHQDSLTWLDDLRTNSEVAFVQQTSAPGRVPEGQTLLQVGACAEQADEMTLDKVRQRWHLPEPTTQLISSDSEALRLPTNLTAAQEIIADVKKLLPPGMLLVGSDYGESVPQPGADDLAARLADGQAAARSIKGCI